jgi:hypothetical protein
MLSSTLRVWGSSPGLVSIASPFFYEFLNEMLVLDIIEQFTLIPDRLMAGQRPLKPLTLVRVQVREPFDSLRSLMAFGR